MVRVVAHLRRQVERDGQARHALLKQVPIPGVRLGRGPRSRVLPRRPQPAAVYRGLDASRVSEGAWLFVVRRVVVRAGKGTTHAGDSSAELWPVCRRKSLQFRPRAKRNYREFTGCLTRCTPDGV